MIKIEDNSGGEDPFGDDDFQMTSAFRISAR